MAYKRISPIPEIEGGTNQTTYATGDILYSDATNSLAKLTAGSDDEVLTLASGIPSWAAAGGGDVNGPASSTDRAIATWNGTGGDALFDNSSITISANGEMVNTLQPAFLGYVSTTINNITGNGTDYFLGDTDVGAALTENYDQGSDFNPGASGGAVFTAPVTGKYIFCSGIRTDNYGTANNSYAVISTSNGIYQLYVCGGANSDNSSNLLQFGNSLVAEMDIGDVARTRITVEGNGGKNIDIIANNRNTYFSGALIC